MVAIARVARRHARRLRWGALAVVVTVGMVLGASCGDDETSSDVAALGEGCLLDSDCTSPLACVFRRCHQKCKEDRDCPSEQRCVTSDRPFRVCLLPDESHCTYTSECGGALVCGIDGRCRNECAADRDCVPNQVCATGTCASQSELVDGGLVPLSSGGPETGQPCSYTSECPGTLVCLDGKCRGECLTDADCAPYPCDTATHRCLVPAQTPCVPGQQVECACPASSVKGAQVCAPDGKSFEPCTGCPDAG